MAKRRFTSQFLYQFEAFPVLLTSTFKVDSTAPNGVTNLQGEGISAIYMNSSAPSAANPNPAAGIILVQLQDSYFRSLGLFSSFSSPQTGSDLTSTVANVTNVISVLGTATLAQWQAVGLPKGVVPKVGVGFIATSAAAIGGSGAVKIVLATGSGITNLEYASGPSAGVAETAKLAAPLPPVGSQAGGQIILRAYKNSVLTAPASGTFIHLGMLLSNSSVTVAGQ